MTANLNSPAITNGPLTADELAEYVRQHYTPQCCTGDCRQGRDCPMRQPAEAWADLSDTHPQRTGHARLGALARGWLWLKRALS